SAEAASGRYLLEPIASAPVQSSGLIDEGEMFALSIDDVITTVEGDLWSFYGNSGDSVTVSLYSDDFDSYLELLDSNGNLLAQDDDSAGDLDSQINFVLPFSGTYQIKAHAYNNGASSGAYTLTLEIGSGSSSSGGTSGGTNTSDQVFMGYLVANSVTGSISTAGGDVWQFDGSSGQSVSISMFSTDGSMDCYLELYDDFGNLLISDDDGAGNLNSQITGFSIPQEGTYYIVAKTFGGSGRGGYSLTVTIN
ncbi:MAG: PPC domain-containing protein, partial [Chitinophagaceae bacterium]|nr:PPC domain-containing protein [Anaerolineae bacterium]